MTACMAWTGRCVLGSDLNCSESAKRATLPIGDDARWRQPCPLSSKPDIETTSLNGFREFADAGGLMSYGPNLPDMYRQSARLVDKILKGANPADLPFELPTRYELSS